MKKQNNTADHSFEANVTAVKVSSNETSNCTICDIAKAEDVPPLAYLSVSEIEGRPGIYTEGFEYTFTFFSDLHRATCRYGYSTMIFKDNYRKKENVIGYGNVIIFDIDDGYTIEEVKNLLSGVKHLIVTTSSHQKQKKEKSPCDRFRILLQSDKVINSKCDAETYREIMISTLDLLGIDINKVDTACLGADRFYKPSQIQQHWYGRGELIPMLQMTTIATDRIKVRRETKLKRREARKIRTPKHFTYEQIDIEKVISALNQINPDLEYENWIKIGMALKNEFGEEGFDLWDRWSSQGEKYEPVSMQKKWNSFGGLGLSIATVFYIAKGGM